MTLQDVEVISESNTNTPRPPWSILTGIFRFCCSLTEIVETKGQDNLIHSLLRISVF